MTNLSPPKTRARVSAGRTSAAEAVADGAQQLVAHLVTKVVVDHLEAVDVAEEDGDVALGALGLQQGVVEVVEQQPPVRQARERVLERVTGQLLLEGLALGRCARKTITVARR